MKIKTTLPLLLLLAFFKLAIASEERKFQEPEPTLIEVLQDGESFSIEITSISCFNGTRQTVLVANEAGVITATLQDHTKILTQEDIEAFIAFEFQLRNLKMGGCSTVDTYVLKYGSQKWQTSDGTCSWNGGRELLKVFA